MSVFNGEGYLSSSIESILNQTRGDFEFIIIDDGSTDRSWDIMRGYRDQRMKLHQNRQNIGLTKSLNKALALATGDYVFRQDADDISHRSRLEEQLNFLEQNPHIVLLGSAVTLIDDSGSRSGELIYHPHSDKSIRWQLLLQNSFFHTSVSIRRRVLAENNLRYCTEIQYAQDYEFWSRVLKYGEGANIHAPLVSIRLHRDQLSHQKWDSQQETATTIAMENIANLGLGDEFTPDQVWLMRCLDLDWGSLSDEERFEGGISLRRLLAGFERVHRESDDQWVVTRRRVLKQVHRCIFQKPHNFNEFTTQWNTLGMSPKEALADLLILMIKGVRSALRV